MDRSGRWSLSPAFDVTYSYNPSGPWTGTHQMSLNGKRDNFEADDFIACAENAAMKRGRAAEILLQVQQAVSRWKEFAQDAGVPRETIRKIASTHRTDIIS